MSPADWERRRQWLEEQRKLAQVVYDAICAAQRECRRDPESPAIATHITIARTSLIPLYEQVTKRAPL